MQEFAELDNIQAEQDVYVEYPGDADYLRQQALDLLEAEQDEQGWQYLLKTIAVRPDDRVAVVQAIRVLTEQENYQGLSNLCCDYLEMVPDDDQIREVLENTNNILLEQHNDNQQLQIKREQLKLLVEQDDQAGSDIEHLQACMEWLFHAGQVNASGGMSAVYQMDTETWGADSPEITGCIIPTFLAYHKLTGHEKYLQSAIDMAGWQISSQAIDGGAGEAFGVYGLESKVFSSSQMALGLMSLFAYTGLGKYKAAAVKAIDWIVNCQEQDGNWTRNTYAGAKSFHVRMAWVMLEMFDLTQDVKYKQAAEKSFAWTLSCAMPNGWFENTSVTEPGRPRSNVIGYTLSGLFEVCRFEELDIDRYMGLELLTNAAENILISYERSRENGQTSGLPGTLDLTWSSLDNWSCVPGNVQIAIFLRKMSWASDNTKMQQTADTLVEETKKIQMLDSENGKDIYGGLSGSYPLWQSYQPYRMPVWGAKFFADSLLQRLLPQEHQSFLG